VRRLIINADDFGLTDGVNRAIIETHQRGVVTSATLMANSQAFAAAVALRPQVPNLSVGCHVVLIDGRPVANPASVTTLMANGDGFRNGLIGFAADAVRGKIREEHVYEEAMAQFRKLQSAGVTPTHFDSHKHSHLFPSILKPLLRAAGDCGIRALRNPFAPLKPLAFAHLARRPKLWTRYSEVAVLRGFYESFRHAVADSGMVTTDGSLGIVVTGALDHELFRAIVGCIPEGTWEFVCHPGYVDRQLSNIRTRLRESRQKELEVLTSEGAREILQQHGIELISYRELS